MTQMRPDALETYAVLVRNLEAFPDDQMVYINARDLEAFGHPVPEGAPGGRPIGLTIGEFRALGSNLVLPEVEGCEECP